MRSPIHLALVLAVTAAVLPVAARAGTQNVLGKLFLLRDPRPGVDATRRQAVVTARETHSTATIAGDPTAAGATLTILANGGTSTMETFLLPLDAWQRDSSASYTYDDGAALHGPVERVTIRRTARGTNAVNPLSHEATKELADSSNAKVVIIGAGREGLPVILGGDAFASHERPTPPAPAH